MNEQEWLAAESPDDMLRYLGERASKRKQRLFACGCCRRIPKMSDAHKHILDLAERYADGGGVSKRQLKSAVRRQRPATRELYSDEWEIDQAIFQAAAVQMDAPHGWYDLATALSAATHAAFVRVPHDIRHYYERFSMSTAWCQERAAQAELVRDLFNNPFRPPYVRHDKVTQDVAIFAVNIYEQSLYSALPIFADALEEADCADEHVLAHCRAGGSHMRGCWVIDTILRRQ